MSKDKSEQMMSKAGYRLCNVYTYLSLVIFIILGSMCIHSSHNIDNLSVTVAPTNLQVRFDWLQ